MALLELSGDSDPNMANLLKRYEGTHICIRALTCDVSSRPDVVCAVGALEDLPKV